MQTALTTFTKGNVTIELHAQLHFGDLSYYDYYNSRTFNTRFDAVLYELLLDEGFLEKPQPAQADPRLHAGSKKSVGTSSSVRPTRDGLSPLQASPHDRATAAAYGWCCQVDHIQYAQPHWMHADWTRQEFLARLQSAGFPHVRSSTSSPTWEAPLWQLTKWGRIRLPDTATEAVAALVVGPPLLFTQPDALSLTSRRRLFRTLTLPESSLNWASSIAYMFRAVLWLTVPCPELSVLLVDWSTLLTTTSKDSSTLRGARISPLTLPLLESLLQGRWNTIRQLVFGQVMTSRHSIGGLDDGDDFLIFQRNERAIQILEETLAGCDEEDTATRIALLYGCSHCPDLSKKLTQLGFVPTQTTWRTAWKIDVGSNSKNVSGEYNKDRIISPEIRIAMGLLLPMYLVVGGLDWMATWHELVDALAGTSSGGMATVPTVLLQSIGVVSLYLIRHVFEYVMLSKFLLDWNEPPSASQSNFGS